MRKQGMNRQADINVWRYEQAANNPDAYEAGYVEGYSDGLNGEHHDTYEDMTARDGANAVGYRDGYSIGCTEGGRLPILNPEKGKAGDQ